VKWQHIRIPPYRQGLLPLNLVNSDRNINFEIRKNDPFNVWKEKKMSMIISNSQKQGRVLVTILALAGKLDGSNYSQLIEEARKNFLNGVQDVLIDLSELTFLSSAGLAAIHQSALIFCGQPILEEESGWASYHAIDRDRGSRVHTHLKLYSPQPKVADILDIVGFNSLFEIHTDLETAVASF
jgi:anti-anti-sigma regulatory factor